MTVEEVFKSLSSHMIKGIMIHEQMSDYYDFLSLHGYKKCHEYHMRREMNDLRRLHKYFINHYNRLIEEDQISNPDAIPSSWYRYTRQEVDTNTKRSAIKAGIEKWVSWEQETKDLYQKMYKELYEIGEIAAAKEVCQFVHDVDCELKWAQKKHINLVTADYDIGYILGEQEHLHDWYAEKLG